MLSQKVFPDTQSYTEMLRQHGTQRANNTLKDRIADMPTCCTVIRQRSNRRAVRRLKQIEHISDDGQPWSVNHGDGNMHMMHAWMYIHRCSTNLSLY